MKEMKENLNNGKTESIERLNTMKSVSFPHIYLSTTMAVNIPAQFFIGIDKVILKFVE